MTKQKCTAAILFFFLLIGFAAFSQQSTDTSWNSRKAERWFKSKEWRKGLPISVHPSVDKVEFARQYHRNKATWDKAFAFLRDNKLEDLQPRRYPIDSTQVYATVTEAPSKEFEKTNWESHRKYIDLQYVIRGKEKIGVASAPGATITRAYDEKADVQNYSTEGKYYIAEPGKFFLFFPHNAHRPTIKVEGYDVVKKLVIKIRVAE